MGWFFNITGFIADIFGSVPEAIDKLWSFMTPSTWAIVLGLMIFIGYKKFTKQKKEKAHYKESTTQKHEDLPSPPGQSSYHQSKSLTTAGISTNKSQDGRIFVNTSPFDLQKKVRGMTGYQADKVKEPYLGKWLKILVEVSDVESAVVARSDDSEKDIKVWCYCPSRNADDKVSIVMHFNADRWETHLSHIELGEQIKVLGEIYNIGEGLISLKNCEKE